MVAPVNALRNSSPRSIDWSELRAVVRNRAKRMKMRVLRQQKNIFTINGFVFACIAAFTVGAVLGFAAVAASSFIMSVIGEDNNGS